MKISLITLQNCNCLKQGSLHRVTYFVSRPSRFGRKTIVSPSTGERPSVFYVLLSNKIADKKWQAGSSGCKTRGRQGTEILGPNVTCSQPVVIFQSNGVERSVIMYVKGYGWADVGGRRYRLRFVTAPWSMFSPFPSALCIWGLPVISLIPKVSMDTKNNLLTNRTQSRGRSVLFISRFPLPTTRQSIRRLPVIVPCAHTQLADSSILFYIIVIVIFFSSRRRCVHNFCKCDTNYCSHSFFLSVSSFLDDRLLQQASRCVGKNSRVPVCHCRCADDRAAGACHCFQLQLLLPQRDWSGRNAVTELQPCP